MICEFERKCDIQAGRLIDFHVATYQFLNYWPRMKPVVIHLNIRSYLKIALTVYEVRYQIKDASATSVTYKAREVDNITITALSGWRISLWLKFTAWKFHQFYGQIKLSTWNPRCKIQYSTCIHNIDRVIGHWTQQQNMSSNLTGLKLEFSLC